MMGSSRTNEKGKAPAAGANPLIEVNNDYAAHGLNFLEGNVDEDDFDFVPDTALSLADWEDINRSVAQGIPETNVNPRVYSMNPNPDSFRSPRIDMSSNTANTIYQEVPLLPDWNMRWGQQCMNQGHNIMSAGGVSTFGGESNFGNLNRPQVIRDIGGSSSIFHPIDTAPVHIHKNVNFNTGHTGVQGKGEGSFLSLGIGGTEEAISRSQLGSREIFDKLKEEPSTELKIAHARQETLVQTLDADFMGFQRNNSGSSSRFSNVHQVPLTNNEIGVHHIVNSGPGTSPHHIFPMQQNEKQHGRNLRSGDLDHYRADKLKETASTELKITHAQKATGQTSDAGFMGFQHNNCGLSNQFSHVNQMTLTNNEVGVHGTPNSGTGSSPYHILQMQQNDMQHGRSIRSGDWDQYRMFAGNQAMHSGTLGGNSTHFFNPQQHSLNNLASEYAKPLWVASCTPSGQLQNTRCRTGNSLPSRSSMNSPTIGLGSSARQNSAAEQRQLLAHNAMPAQTLGGNLYSQRTAAPQVCWVGTGPAGSDAPFPKRLGVEFNGRNSLQAAQRHISPMGTSLQTTGTGQAYQLPDKGSTRQPVNVLRPSIDRTDGTPASYPLNSQEPFFAIGQSQDALVQLSKDPRRTPPTHGHSQDALIQHPKDPRVAPSTNALTVDGLSQKCFHTRPPHKRTAVGPHPASSWVQRQKIIHPTIHHPMQKSASPVTTAPVHPSISVVSRTQLAGPIAARIRPSVPCTSHLRPVPVTTAPVASHITWKDPDATAKLSGYKCFLCKRDLALTSEGPVYQPTVPPPTAVLPCGHTFHDQCLQNITPNDQAKDPPCIPCAIGEN